MKSIVENINNSLSILFFKNFHNCLILSNFQLETVSIMEFLSNLNRQYSYKRSVQLSKQLLHKINQKCSNIFPKSKLKLNYKLKMNVGKLI